MVFPPPRSPPPKLVPEAHLYLSPAHRSGIGNHSVVYKAELEILRSILVDDGARKMQGGDAKLLGESSQSAGTPDSELNTPKLAEFERTNAPLVPEVKWQNPERGPYWSHLQQSSRCEQGPVTAKVSVAKLSVQYDEHLLREARNYQFFPSHSTTP